VPPIDRDPSRKITLDPLGEVFGADLFTHVLETVKQLHITQKLASAQSTVPSGRMLHLNGNPLDHPFDETWFERGFKIIDIGASLPALQRTKDLMVCFTMYNSSLARNPDGSPIPNRYNHDRFIHSERVAKLCMAMALIGDLTVRESLVLMGIGLYHDVSHCPGSHSGQEIVRRIGFPEFDHDLQSSIEISSGEMRKVAEQISAYLKTFGVELDPEEYHKDLVAGLLGEAVLDSQDERAKFESFRAELSKHGLPDHFILDLDSSIDRDRMRRFAPLNKLAQDYVDMFEYLLEDIGNTGADIDAKVKVANAIVEAILGTRVRNGKQLVVTSIDVFRKFLGVFNNVSQEHSLSGLAALIEGVALDGARKEKILVSQLLAPQDGGDQRLLSRLPRENQVSLMRGADRFYRPCFEVSPLHSMTDEKQGKPFPVTQEQMLTLEQEIGEIGKRLKEEMCLPERFEVIVNPFSPIKKRWDLELEGNARREALALIKSGSNQTTYFLNKLKYEASDRISIQLSFEEIPAQDSESSRVIANFRAMGDKPWLSVGLKVYDPFDPELKSRIIDKETQELFKQKFEEQVRALLIAQGLEQFFAVTAPKRDMFTDAVERFASGKERN